MKISKENAPCYGCQERKVGCHSNCEKYITFIKLVQEEKATAMANINAQATIDAYSRSKNDQIKKYLRWRRRK